MNKSILENKKSRVLLHCTHCGDSTMSPIRSDKQIFCCHGCQTVFHALKEKNLLQYYKLRERAGINTGIKPTDINQDDFSYMSQSKFQAEYLKLNENGLSIKYYLEGIHCVACVWLLEKVPHFITEVNSARVDLSKSTLEITITPEADLEYITSEISKIGYRPHPIKSNEEVEYYKLKEDRLKLIQIGVAGACSANIMLYSISIYAGAGEIFSNVFGWVSFILTLPIIFFSALPFYKSSLSSIKKKTINIDIPISLAIILASITGFYNLVMGINHFYFDSIATLVFLLLTSRYLVHKSLQNGLDSTGLKSLFEQSGILRFNKELDYFESIHSEHLQVGDMLKIRQGQSFPNDGEVIEGEGHVNNSLISGESTPIKVTINDQVFAGAQNISEDLIVRVTHSFNESTLGKIISTVESTNNSKTYLHSLTDKLSKWFVSVVFALSLFCFFYFLNTLGIDIAIKRTLSLIIISCPCALGLASPLALARAMSLARRSGIIIKSERSIEELANSKSIYFDKTGTLTKGNFTVSWVDSNLDLDKYKEIIYSLEKKSSHPIAKALREWSRNSENLKLTNYKECPGSGVSATIAGNHYFLGKARNCSDLKENTIVEFNENDQLLATFFLSDELRPEAFSLIQSLKESDKNIFILSGDQRVNVEFIGEKLSLLTSNCFGDQTPESKAQIIAKDHNTLMVGDGANDAIAMKEANVSISVRGAMGISLRASDIYLTNSPMESLKELFILANKTYKAIKINLALSISYNVFGITLAFLGYISPLVAAVLMPISSATVIIATLINLKGRES
ncbi:cadmium-translocating P-type ATPase [Halobacteriovorax marinus]|mgnify:CR=1 FL=1|uniref:Cadmium-translocating P-type ATPase n=1 Tax=Halobacteriovorax marinus TaxID=97084 RepID=A0A1Y5F864_9BACT|nr:cadmium-translocating P-type ATPase [Halobacteriovorax marinus]